MERVKCSALYSFHFIWVHVPNGIGPEGLRSITTLKPKQHTTMKKVIISRESGARLWQELTSYKSNMGINMLGFSIREVKYVSCDNEALELIYNVKEELVDEFLTSLNEASAVDFNYKLSDI